MTCFYCGAPLTEDTVVWVYVEFIDRQIPCCSDDRSCEPSMAAMFGSRKEWRNNANVSQHAHGGKRVVVYSG